MGLHFSIKLETCGPTPEKVVRIISRSTFNAHSEPIFKQLKMYSDLRFSPAPKIHLAITSTQIQFTLIMACTPTSWRESVPKTGTDSILSYLARGALWLASELKEKQVKGMKVWGVTGWSFMMAAVEVLRDIRTFILETSQAWRTHLHWKQVFEQIFSAKWYGNLHTNTKILE